MFEKVNPSHPDKIADRIAGAMVDMAYKGKAWPHVAVEVLIGHGVCHIIAETDFRFSQEKVEEAVRRISEQKHMIVDLVQVPQDGILNDNQRFEMRCGDNGIFKGVPVTKEETDLAVLARMMYEAFPHDGKYVLEEKNDELDVTICQSNVRGKVIELLCKEWAEWVHEEKTGARKKTVLKSKINPLGYWTGGTDVDTGATNRKLGSDMGNSVTGGGLHGKDLSKADVSVNIYAWQKAQRTGKTVELHCAIGDETIDGRPYEEVVEEARTFIDKIGGFEKFAEWGLL